MRGKRSGLYTPKRRGDDDGDEGSTRWLGTYADAITLLLAFFVMLYAMSELDVMKFEAFIRGLETPFGNTAMNDGLLDAQPSIVGDSREDREESRHEPIALPVPVRPHEPDDADTLTLQDLEQLAEVEAALVEALEASGMADLASFRFDGRGLVMSLATDDVLFATGSTRISSLGQELIATVANPLARFSNDVFVEGHTDDVPFGRQDYTNWNLSTDRAVAVVSLMTSRHSIDPDRLGAAGYAEYRPRAGNDTVEGRAANRRVDILIVAQGVTFHG
jgi:chemotaxis protein MotB